jgi:hypothetical protein
LLRARKVAVESLGKFSQRSEVTIARGAHNCPRFDRICHYFDRQFERHGRQRERR